MKSKLHGFSGALALLCIATFWMSTAVSEIFLDLASVTAAKNAILIGMWILIPSMAAAGGSGFSLAGSRRGRLVDVKAQRMMPVLNMRDGLRLSGRLSARQLLPLNQR